MPYGFGLRRGALSDPDVVLYAAGVSVWSRWFIWLVGVFLLAHRPGFWYPGDIEFLAIPVLLGMLNRPGAPPAPHQQACALALDAIPQRRGHCVVGSPAGEPLSAAAVATQTVRGLPLQHDLPVRVHLIVRVAGACKDAC